MPVNLQLGTVNAQGAQTRRPSPSAGEGMVELGQSLIGVSDTLLKLRSKTNQEDPAAAYTYALNKVAQLDELERALKTNADGTPASATDLDNRMRVAYKAFNLQAAQEMTDLNITKLGSQHLYPRALESFNKLSLYRSQLYGVEGTQKLEQAANGLRNQFPKYGVGFSEEFSTETLDDGTKISKTIPVLRFDNEHTVLKDLNEFAPLEH